MCVEGLQQSWLKTLEVETHHEDLQGIRCQGKVHDFRFIDIILISYITKMNKNEKYSRNSSNIKPFETLATSVVLTTCGKKTRHMFMEKKTSLPVW